jgi:hypothetical protein
MAQSLEVNIKTTSDVPQAMDKAKAATTGFGKQIEDISKKFGTSFKDIFLSFLGPMAILTTVLAFIGKAIADNQKKSEDAHQAAINNTNELMSAEDKYYENKRNNEKKSKEKVEEAKTTREDVTEEFLRSDPRGQKMVAPAPGPAASFNKGSNELIKAVTLGGDVQAVADAAKRKLMSQDKAVQDQVQALIAEDIKKNPAAGEAAKTPTGPTSFKTPEGFGNVVGVGANPVMEAMTMQLEESRKQTALLESLNNKSPGGGVPTDFTKTPIPSRAAMLQGGN